MSVQYHEVKRKANVGEQIKIVDAGYTGGRYSNGSEFTVTGFDDDYVLVGSTFDDGSDLIIEHSEYVVLEPLADRLTADIAQMAVRLAAAERNLADHERLIAELKRAQSSGTVAQKISESLRALAPKPRSRDDIIAQAKRDVVELTMQYTGMDSRVKFIVNRDKRTVVALRYYFGEVDYRGKAVCDPDDCFNVHIGKAIALRRTLGLEVPEEYVKCPAPTEVRVGDIVETFLSEGEPHETFKVAGIRKGKREILLYDTLEKYSDDGTYTPFEPEIGDRVIDDSREEA